MNLSLSQNQIILGGLLGDSYYSINNNSIRFYHSDKQRNYLEWKYSFFDKEFTKGIYRRNINDTYFASYFEFVNKHSEYDDLFNFIGKHLYTSKRKKISMKYLNELSPLGLSVWWMDDGCLSIHKGNRYGKLCTHSFNKEENILIKKYFKEKLGIDVDIKTEKGEYYFIRFNVTALKKFIRIIYKYVSEVPDMIYKIDLDYTNQKSIGDFCDVYNYIKEHKNHFTKEL